MNILFLNSLGKNKWGGGEKWMVSAGKGLAARGHRVTIACLKGSRIEDKSVAAGLDTWHFSIPADIAFWKIPTLKNYLLRNDIDVLVCCQNKDVRIGARTARQAGIKAIFARQGVQNLTNRKKYIVPFTRYIDGLITNTISIKQTYEEFGWFPQDFIHVVYNGVEVRDMPPIILQEAFDLPPESKTIFSAGRLDYQKGFDLLIEVAARAAHEDLQWQFVVAGEGKQKRPLRALAEKKNVADRMHFIGFSEQIPSLVRGADVFVLPSRYEGMPNALLEAMAAGKACVATEVNGAVELIETGRTGMLVQPENPVQLFEKIQLLLTDDALRKDIGAAARRHVLDKFSYEAMTDQLEALLKKQLSKTASPC
jgi:glycosyltransferase involved in cell wall biosynthesis